jgi:hypothetical protein
VAEPFLRTEVIMEIIGRFPIQFGESFGFKLFIGFAEGVLGDLSNKRFCMVNGFEKIIRLFLIGAFDRVHQEENDGIKRPDKITDEVFGGFFI